MIDAGNGSIGGLDYPAGVTLDNIERILWPTLYINNVGAQHSSVVVSSVGMDGGNGGWPVLYGTMPSAGGQIDLSIDEDQINDS